MGLKPTFTQAQFKQQIEEAALRIQNEIVRYLQRLGEMCLIECRTNKTYQDQTGNLTASMGYIVIANGRAVKNGGFDSKLGGATGQSLAYRIATQFRTGYALIVVAGMNYAYEVETRGYNVLTSAELLAERKLPGMIVQLRKNIAKSS